MCIENVWVFALPLSRLSPFAIRAAAVVLASLFAMSAVAEEWTNLPAFTPTPTPGEQQPIAVEEPVVVVGRSDSLVGVAESASQGTVGATQLEERPLLRPGEVLETVPGMIVTQHSGDGKANEYFLRGFNLDHGTDFATSVDGVPVNLPTHAHGQGYTDLNFMIPELVEAVNYKKGVYYADEGDFSSAGAADLEVRSCPAFQHRPRGIRHVRLFSRPVRRLAESRTWQSALRRGVCLQRRPVGQPGSFPQG